MLFGTTFRVKHRVPKVVFRTRYIVFEFMFHLTCAHASNATLN